MKNHQEYPLVRITFQYTIKINLKEQRPLQILRCSREWEGQAFQPVYLSLPAESLSVSGNSQPSPRPPHIKCPQSPNFMPVEWARGLQNLKMVHLLHSWFIVDLNCKFLEVLCVKIGCSHTPSCVLIQGKTPSSLLRLSFKFSLHYNFICNHDSNHYISLQQADHLYISESLLWLRMMSLLLADVIGQECGVLNFSDAL